MRATIAYTSARILLLVVSVILLYLAGARGLLLLALAFLVSGILSFVLLSRQRDVMSSALMARIRNGRRRAAEFRARIEEGARAEDEELQLPDGGACPDHRRRRHGAPGPLGSSASHPPLIRSFSTAPTAWSEVMAEVSSTRSASRGSSYGSDTPVKPLIRPARALAYRPLRSRCSQTSTDVAM